MPLVTVPGVNSITIDLQFQTAENTFRTLGLLGQIYTAEALGVLNVENAPTSPPSGPKPINEYTLGDSNGQRGTGPMQGTVPAGYLGIVDANLSSVPSDIVGATQVNETVVAAGSLHFSTEGGSGTLISAQGNNIITAPDFGGGNWSVFFDSGDNTVYATSGNFLIDDGTNVTFGHNLILLGSGSDTVESWGEDTVIAAPTGSNLIALFHSGSVAYGSTGPDTVINQGSGGDTVVQGTGPETVFADASNSLYYGNLGELTFVSGILTSNTVVAGAGNATLYGALNSKSLFFVGGGRFMLDGGSGDETVVGATGTSNSAVLFAENGGIMNLVGNTDNVLVAGAGSATLNGIGALGNNIFFAGLGSDSIVAGAGSNTLVGGPSSDTLIGGRNVNAFEFNGAFASLGNELIGNWNSRDRLILSGYGAPTAPGGLPAHATKAVLNGSEVLTLSDGTRITFMGIAHVNPWQIHVS